MVALQMDSKVYDIHIYVTMSCFYSVIYYSANGPDTLLLVIRKPAIKTFIVNETPCGPAAVVFNNHHRLLLYLGFYLESILHTVLESEAEDSSVFLSPQPLADTNTNAAKCTTQRRTREQLC